MKPSALPNFSSSDVARNGRPGRTRPRAAIDSRYAVDAALRLPSFLRRYKEMPITMIVGMAIDTAMVAASLPPLNAGPVFDCCAEEVDDCWG